MICDKNQSRGTPAVASAGLTLVTSWCRDADRPMGCVSGGAVLGGGGMGSDCSGALDTSPTMPLRHQGAQLKSLRKGI